MLILEFKFINKYILKFSFDKTFRSPKALILNIDGCRAEMSEVKLKQIIEAKSKLRFIPPSIEKCVSLFGS